MTKHVVQGGAADKHKDHHKDHRAEKESIWRSQPDDHKSPTQRGSEEAQDHQNEGAKKENQIQAKITQFVQHTESPEEQHFDKMIDVL